MTECKEKHFSNNTLWEGRGAYKYHQSAFGRIFLLRSVAGSTARKFLRTRSYRRVARVVCGQTRHSYTLQPVCSREKLQMRRSNFYEEYSLVAVLFLFSECAARSLAYPFSFRLSRAAETGKGEREKEQRTNSRKCENATRYASEFTGDDTHMTHFLCAFAFLFFLFLPPPFRQITDFRRCQVLHFMYIQPHGSAQFCEGISSGSVFTEGYNFTAVYNLRLQESLCLFALRAQYLLIVIDIGRLYRIDELSGIQQ